MIIINISEKVGKNVTDCLQLDLFLFHFMQIWQRQHDSVSEVVLYFYYFYYRQLPIYSYVPNFIRACFVAQYMRPRFFMKTNNIHSRRNILIPENRFCICCENFVLVCGENVRMKTRSMILMNTL